jgi:hypothetical protein
MNLEIILYELMILIDKKNNFLCVVKRYFNV